MVQPLLKTSYKEILSSSSIFSSIYTLETYGNDSEQGTHMETGIVRFRFSITTVRFIIGLDIQAR